MITEELIIYREDIDGTRKAINMSRFSGLINLKVEELER
jgi:hypothetical protein